MTADADEDWRHRAYCADKPPESWESRRITTPRQAERLCAPCPVRQQCALWASEQPALCGVVVAGIALPEDPTDPKHYEGARRFMAAQYGVPYRRFCVCCLREIGEHLGLGARGLCNSCYRHEWHESRKSA